MIEFKHKQADLVRLLRYAKELLVINAQVISDIDALKFPRFYDWQLAGLEGITLHLADDNWVALRRLKETQPPAPGPLLSEWIAPERHPGPDRQPSLKKERIIKIPTETVDELLKVGKLDPADVLHHPEDESERPRDLNVIQRSADMLELQAAWQAYLDGPWAKWAEIERPRRRSIHVYNVFYQTHQQIVSMGLDNPIELVFGAGVARWQHEIGRISSPLIEQLIETELLEDGTLILRPRSSDPSLNLKPFHAAEILGSKQLQIDAAEQLSRTVNDPDVGFSPANRQSYEQILRMCVARLSSTGVYLPDQDDFDRSKPLSNPDETLRVSNTWVIYVRQRQENAREQDFERLIKQVDNAKAEEDLPAAALRFVEQPSQVAVDDGPSIIDLNSNSITLPTAVEVSGPPSRSAGAGGNGGAGGKPAADAVYFFPLPYNDDQMEIAKLLEAHEGVLVQGPPGTGKTHTIANIICHYLAKGKRVLVTAKTPEALTALQEKIPEQIRGLAISVIHNDREGNAQLERAVRLLSDEIKSIRRDELEREIAEKHSRLSKLELDIQAVDRQLEDVAARNYRSVIYKGKETTPMALAKAVVAGKGRYDWFEDKITLEEKFQPQFTDADIAEIRTLRQQLNSDLVYSISLLPDPAILPDLPNVLSAHRELAWINDIDSRTDAGLLPPMSNVPDAPAMARTLADWLRSFAAFMEAAREEGWILSAYHKFIGVTNATPPNLAVLRRSLDQWAELASRGETFALKAIVLNLPAENTDVYDRAIHDLANGKQPFGMFSFFKGGLKAALDSITIEGRKPTGQADWADILAYRDWQKAVTTFAQQWNAISAVVETRALANDWQLIAAEIVRLGGTIRDIGTFSAEVEGRRKDIKTLFPYAVDIDAVLHHGDCTLVLNAVQLNVEKAELASAKTLADGLKLLARAIPLPFHSGLRELIANLGNTEISTHDIGEAWKSIVVEANRLHGLTNSLARLEALVAKVASSGALLWAKRLRWKEYGHADATSLTPENWRDAWEWTRGAAYVGTLADRVTSQRLSQQRKLLEDERRKLFLDVVRLRTFLGLKRRIVPSVDAALAKFVSAINRLGKGTGVTAGKYRRLVRESAAEAADAVPCWIMPEWRISEQLPADLAAFDLVVIDESSQSDITALPAIMRAKKVLIVGDDKQVSPTPIGIEARKISQLTRTYLTGLPFEDQMDPATSLYELGGMIFPGKTVMLREHFRCVEPIIRFSSKFYPKPLIPLRIPKASERLDPPLIDMYVPFGLRDMQKRNLAEAEVIINEIANLAADPNFAKRTIGVISLLGSEQARLIYERLLVEIGAEAMERHRIMCGDAATFQGQERDIIFLSMVASPDSVIKQTARLYEQRYNVAMSRARDRLVLVRSVAVSHLKPGDLKLQVIEHFRKPMEQANVVQSDDILAICGSDFERDVGRRLLDLGYRITPQYPISGYHIDFIIEGADDRRLAVELDGDKYHGPDRWASDVARQRSLERMNWRFWRCWGSAWLADSDGCLADLLDTLKQMGIEPLGAAPVAGVYTHHIEVKRPLAEDGTTPAPPQTAFQDHLHNTPAAAAVLPIGVGDLITLSYANAPEKLLRYRLTDGPNDLEKGLLSTEVPLGAALLGASEEDEIAVRIAGEDRQVLINKVDKKMPVDVAFE